MYISKLDQVALDCYSINKELKVIKKRIWELVDKHWRRDSNIDSIEGYPYNNIYEDLKDCNAYAKDYNNESRCFWEERLGADYFVDDIDVRSNKEDLIEFINLFKRRKKLRSQKGRVMSRLSNIGKGINTKQEKFNKSLPF